MKSMNGQRVVIIGGSSGIGLATAIGAVTLGAEVIIAARTAEKLERAQKRIGHSVETAKLDMSREDQVQRSSLLPMLRIYLPNALVNQKMSQKLFFI